MTSDQQESLSPKPVLKDTASTLMAPVGSDSLDMQASEMPQSGKPSVDSPVAEEPDPPGSGLKINTSFWAVIATLCFTSLLGSFENAVITTSMPYMIRDLGIGSNYVWITNGFFVASAAVQPLFSQLADVFGRRRLTLVIVGTHTLGSGICGGAKNGPMLLAGRAVQGIGSGGINMIIEVIISDLVPLRQRGYFMSLVLLTYALGLGTGPLIGGSLAQNVGWRWVFWINLPIGGTSLGLLYLLLRVKDDKTTPLRDKIKNIDYIGNTLVIGSTVSVLYALTLAGSSDPWGSWQVLVPLLIGMGGFISFVCFEGSRFCSLPVVPLRFFKDRTRAIIFANTLITSILSYWMLYFRPVYFQAVLLSSSTWAGVQMMPSTLGSLLVSAGSSAVLSWIGRYKIFHNAGFGILTLGLGLHALLDSHSSAVRWVMFQILTGSGIGMVLNTLLPALQAGLPESDVAAATGSWAFLRSFGNVWGVAIPMAVFNDRFAQLAGSITEDQVRREFLGGHAYEQGTRESLSLLGNVPRIQVISVFERSLQIVWLVSIAFSGFGFVFSLFENEIQLRTKLESKYGLREEDKKRSDTGDCS
ncbi:major facilitator superfamily transporter [Colletotrichum graminicola]|uniref:Major facilitator superfamily transporter n=1 Tax=Colletotrichum graminicola (strain M1.001 / M2 / FGSC 10212) TaxID=645133 RepID=E3QV06_COLGM|nr:major facilitator superfamily transporter [Colletotrichum graminicola M1.001]EFQ34696.1 major facilitator superfamily transporter [Colletotrichum graminicola M1.001]WDK16949.1 major facilitator superfamily transporter [Colletotrichum graminicola]